MTKHTPGPWFYDKRTESIGCSCGWIGRVQHEHEGDGEFGNPDDDGHLLAAAPELLDLCEDLLGCIKDIKIGFQDWKDYNAVARDARLVIERIGGREG